MKGSHVRIRPYGDEPSIYEGLEGRVLGEATTSDWQYKCPRWAVQLVNPPHSFRSNVIVVNEDALEVIDIPTA